MTEPLQQQYEEACRNLAKNDKIALEKFQTLYDAYLVRQQYAEAMNCYVQLAYAYYNFGELKKMLQLTNDYENLCEKYNTPIDRAMYYPLLSAQYSRLGNDERALYYQQEAVCYAEASLASEQSEEAILRYFSAAKLYAAKLSQMKKLEEAEAVLQHMATYVDHVPSNNFNRPEYFAQHAFVAIQLQKRAEAEQLITCLQAEPLLAQESYIRGRGHVCILQMALWQLEARYEDIYQYGQQNIPQFTSLLTLYKQLVSNYATHARQSEHLPFLIAAKTFEIDVLQRELALNVAPQLAKRKLEDLQHIASRDTLTGIYNRRHFQHAVERWLKEGYTVSLAVFDVDYFKRINDTHGHLIGDELLTYIAETATSYCEPHVQLAGRYGGDEFVLASIEGDCTLKHIFDVLHGATWQTEQTALQLSISMGIASAKEVTFSVLFAKADALLYEAKETRGRCVTEGNVIC